MKKKDARYRQCFIGRGSVRWTAWLPEGLAKTGKTIIPRGQEPATVLRAFRGVSIRHGDLMDLASEHRYHRGRTDI